MFSTLSRTNFVINFNLISINALKLDRTEILLLWFGVEVLDYFVQGYINDYL